VTHSRDAVLQVIDALNAIGSPYLVTGSLARNVYAASRSTNDADFVVDMSPELLEALFKELDLHFNREPQMAFETTNGHDLSVVEKRLSREERLLWPRPRTSSFRNFGGLSKSAGPRILRTCETSSMTTEAVSIGPMLNIGVNTTRPVRS
jgi:hypothetical protein